ncbi:ribosomal protein RSM22 (predicted rRNA methylase) [Ereboglobus sp. PH5-5]|nr:ribosomal protein RSM22 (predicted rRNA methylase) [Ereboglobus sp. PH5-5]
MGGNDKNSVSQKNARPTGLITRKRTNRLVTPPQNASLTGMDWTQLDWQALDRLRDGFIKGTAAVGPYWRTPADLANYDMTYAERIGWKWDAVLSELRRRNWTPPASARALLDWGCGSGVASRRVLRAFGPENFDTLHLWDHSPLARDFAAQAARRDFPDLKIEHSALRTPPSAFVLLLSHVINELSDASLAELTALARRAGAVIWVEPGTHADSRALVSVREKLRVDFDIVAPCAHAAPCGLLAPGAERHWCHNFAEPPRNIYADSDWVKFGKRAGVDLRSLPYSFLVLQKKSAPSAGTARVSRADSVVPDAAARIIGRPRIHKAHAAICSCDAGGVNDLTLYKRDATVLFKQLDRAPAHPPLYIWKRDPSNPSKILGGAPS